MSEHSKNIWCKVKRQSRNMHSGCCSHFKRYVWINFEWPIWILKITNWSLCLRLKLYGILTILIKQNWLVSQKSKNICQREFNEMFTVCKRGFKLYSFEEMMSLAENTSLLVIAAVASLFLSFEPSV